MKNTLTIDRVNGESGYKNVFASSGQSGFPNTAGASAADKYGDRPNGLSGAPSTWMIASLVVLLSMIFLICLWV